MKLSVWGHGTARNVTVRKTKGGYKIEFDNLSIEFSRRNALKIFAELNMRLK